MSCIIFSIAALDCSRLVGQLPALIRPRISSAIATFTSTGSSFIAVKTFRLTPLSFTLTLSTVLKLTLLLKSKGDSKRPFCYITDAIIGLFTVLLRGKKSNAYNIANPNCEVKIKELALVIANLIPDKKVNVKYTKKKHLSNPLKRQNVSIDKIKSLNWFPKVGIHKGFQRTIQFYMNDY